MGKLITKVLLYTVLGLCVLHSVWTQMCLQQSTSNDSDFHIIFITGEDADCLANQNGPASAKVQKVKETLNSINSAQSLNFGVQILSVCRSDSKSMIRVNTEISNQVLLTESCGGVKSTVSSADSILIGIIDSVGLSNVQQLLRSTDIPYISFEEVPDSLTYDSNLLYASSPLRWRAQAIAELAVKLNWDYATVAYGSTTSGRALRQLLEDELREKRVCVDSYIEFLQDATGSQLIRNVTGSDKPRGVIILSAPNKLNPIHSTSSSLSWIVSPELPEKEDFEFLAGAQDSVHIVKQYQLNSSAGSNVFQTLAAVHLLAASVQEVVNSKCSGRIAVCPNLEVEELQKLTNEKATSISVMLDYANTTSTIKFVGNFLQIEPKAPLFQLKEDETYSTASGWSMVYSVAEMNTDMWCTSESCRVKCSQQLPVPDYIYLPGDFIVVVTMPVHDSFNEYPDLWSCNQFNTEASLRAEAATFARTRLNELFEDEGLNLGLLILDTCFNTALTQKLLTDVLNGTTEYCDEEHCLDRSKIIGLVGDYSSHISVTEQRLMIPANIIQVAYGASTWQLDDKTEFTHFLRTHPSATRITANLIKLLDNLNSAGRTDINSVVLMNTDSLYGETTAELVRSHLNKSNYCIIESFQLSFLGEETTSTYDSIWSTLQSYSDRSFVIIYSGEEKPIRDVLDNMKFVNENWWKESGSIFIMTEVWEDRIPLLERYGHILRGSLTFKLKPEFQVDGFQNHLLGIRPSGLAPNLWTTTMYETVKSCKVRGSFTSSTVSICPTNESYAVEGSQVNVEIYALYTIKAIYSLVYGFMNYADRECEGQSVKTCNQLLDRTLYSSQELKHNIGRVKIPQNDSSSETGGDAGLSPFDENLDGNSGYQVFSQQLIPGTSNYRYALVYEFDTNNDISVPNDSDEPVFYTTDDSGSSEVIQDVLVSRSCDLHCASFCPGQEKSDLSSTAVPTKANRQIIVIATCSGIVILILFIAVILLAVKKQGIPCQKRKDTEKETHVYLASGSQSSHSYMGTYSLPYGENRGDNLPMRDSGRQLADELPPLPAPFPPHRLSQTSSSSYYRPMQVTTGTPISTNDPVGELNTPSNERPLSVNSTYIIPNNPYSSTPSEEKPTPIPRKTTIRSSNEDSVNNEQQPSVDEAD